MPNATAHRPVGHPLALAEPTDLARRRARHAMVRALNDEWAGLAEQTHPEVARWAGRHPLLAGCRTLADVAATSREDGVLHVLVAAYLDGSELAGRTVLQAVLGRLVQLAHRDRWAEVGDYVAAFWLVLARYPVRRRPTKVAANLVLDTLKQVRAERDDGPGGGSTVPVGSRLVRLDEEHDLPYHPSVDQAPDAAEVIDAGRRLRLIDEPTVLLLRRVYVDGMSGTEAALACGITPGSVRVRCHRAVRRLAAASDRLLAAA